jgi:hypothetical protein
MSSVTSDSTNGEESFGQQRIIVCLCQNLELAKREMLRGKLDRVMNLSSIIPGSRPDTFVLCMEE